MIRINCAQRSPEWYAARLGIVTASCMDKILTPKTRKPSSSADAYLAKLLAEYALGRTLDDATGPWLERGTDMEAEAVAWYEFEREPTEEVGFVMRDDRMVGCSPDRFVGKDGILEVKVPKVETHMGYVLSGVMPTDYVVQVQGQLLVTERKWVDWMSFNPVIGPLVIRVERDEEFVDALQKAVNAFVARLVAGRELLAARGVERAPVALPGPEARSYGKALEEAGVTDAEWNA